MPRIALSTCCLLLAWTLLPATARAAGERNDVLPGAPSFELLLEKIHRLAAAEAWREPGWKSAEIKAALDQTIAEVNRATKKESVTLPDLWSHLKPADPAVHQDNVLCVCKVGEFTFLSKSLVLADGSVSIVSAKDCIIVARGAVEIVHSERNIVLAGHHLQVVHDGLQEGRSLLMSGGTLSVSHSKESVCCAPRSVRVVFATGTTILNSPNLSISHDRSAVRIKDAVLTTAPGEKKNRLQEKIRITSVEKPAKKGLPGKVRLVHAGVECVASQGSDIQTVDSQEVPELAGWKLTFVGREYVVFSNGREDAGFAWKTER